MMPNLLNRWWKPDWKDRVVLVLLLVSVFVLPWWLLTQVNDWPGLVDKALARERTPSVEARAKGWLWLGLWANWGGLLVLLFGFPWWSRKRSLPLTVVESKWRWSWQAGLAVLVLFVAALVLRLPQMTDSLYNDEAHNYARLFSGTWEPGKEEGDAPWFRGLRWTETLWRNSGGNNAQPFSLLARACLETVKAMGWAVEGEVCEWAVTLPSLVAGLATMWLMMGLVGRRFGVVAGLVVLLVLVVHPWHVRHSTIARGQMLMLLGLVMMLVYLEAALRQGRWRQWLGYGFGMLLCVSSFIGSVYFIAVFNAGLMGWQAVRFKRGEAGSDLLWRPLVSGFLAALAGLALMLPILPDFVEILKHNPAFRGPMGWRWWQDIGGFVYAGTRWLDHAPSNPVNQALVRWITAPWWWPSLFTFVALVGVGTWRMVATGGLWRLLALGTLGGVALTWGLASVQGNYLNLWYLFFTMPWLVTALALAVDAAAKKIPSVGSVVLLVVLLTPQSLVAWRFRHLPKQHTRAPIELARGARYPAYLQLPSSTDALTAGFWSHSALYDPQTIALGTVSQLDTLVQQARQEKRPLFVVFSHRTHAMKTMGDLVNRLEKDDAFMLADVYFGQEEDQFTVHVYQLRETTVSEQP